MTGRYKTLYEELVDERENLFGWFHTPPAVASFDVDFKLVDRVLAREQQREHEREKERKPLWQYRRLFRKAA